MEEDHIDRSLLNLPEPILDCILKLLSPIELIKMSMVCTCLRDACRSDHLWENHINQKWGTIVGDFAFKEWQWHLTKFKSEEEEEEALLDQNCSLGSFCGSCPLPCTGSYLQDFNQLRTFLPNNSMLALYFSLQGGKFWFPAQFYRGPRVRDALFRYDSTSQTFTAREQRVGGRWLLWKGIMWERLRLSPVATPPCFCHVSDCLEDLKPGDHIEIQGKKKSDPHYEWFYAVIGHLDSCNENEEYCCCRHSDFEVKSKDK
ncbi:F-box protein At2g26850-like isoform X3 [Lotus japonicus]|uniref:F-box protein At2g26850-like isoform X3 n=1 Tax=Lotus japonicus TaxID=34305 RepID=UPI00258503FD|nr:F-box protein At2g26850-like isoform X3 [Lotus japonicus]